MDQLIFLRILRITLLMTRGYEYVVMLNDLYIGDFSHKQFYLGLTILSTTYYNTLTLVSGNIYILRKKTQVTEDRGSIALTWEYVYF